MNKRCGILKYSSHKDHIITQFNYKLNPLCSLLYKGFQVSNDYLNNCFKTSRKYKYTSI